MTVKHTNVSTLTIVNQRVRRANTARHKSNDVLFYLAVPLERDFDECYFDRRYNTAKRLLTDYNQTHPIGLATRLGQTETTCMDSRNKYYGYAGAFASLDKIALFAFFTQQDSNGNKTIGAGTYNKYRHCTERGIPCYYIDLTGMAVYAQHEFKVAFIYNPTETYIHYVRIDVKDVQR